MSKLALRPSHLGWLAVGAVLGSVITYLLDPERAPLFKNSERQARKIENLVSAPMTDYASEQVVSDRSLTHKVRKEFSRQIRKPKDIRVSANQGEITLNGILERDELETLIAAVEDVQGVRRVINNLKITEVGTETEIDVTDASDEEPLRH